MTITLNDRSPDNTCPGCDGYKRAAFAECPECEAKKGRGEPLPNDRCSYHPGSPAVQLVRRPGIGGEPSRLCAECVARFMRAALALSRRPSSFAEVEASYERLGDGSTPGRTLGMKS